MALKYKVGDRVKVKNLDWYNRYTNGTEVNCKYYPFSCYMKIYCGQTMTIHIVGGHSYSMIEDDGVYSWTDEMIEGLVEAPLYKATVDKNGNMTGEFVRLKEVKQEINLPEGHIFKDENGNIINATKIVLEKKKKEYPKTYEECLNVLGYDDRETYCVCHTYANERLFESLYRLKVCRDAYWKIAGKEMGLWKPWDMKYGCGEWGYWIGYDVNENKIYCQDSRILLNYYLVFPTEEMRDAFKENFDPDIEMCKEFL